MSAGTDKVIRVWDLASGRTVRTLRGESDGGTGGIITAMALSPDGRWLAAGGSMPTPVPMPGKGYLQGNIRLYDFHSGQLRGLFKRPFANQTTALAFSPDGRMLVSGDAGGFGRIRDVRRLERLADMMHMLSEKFLETYRERVPFEDTMKLLGYVPKGRTTIYPISSIAFTPDGQRLVSASLSDSGLYLWSVAELLRLGRATGQTKPPNVTPPARLSGHTAPVYTVATSPRDGTIASGGVDHTIRLWDGKTGRLIKVLADQGTGVRSLSFSPDGGRLVSTAMGPENWDSHVWSVPEGKEVAAYKGQEGGATTASTISPDGRWVATAGGAGRTIDLWSLHNGRLQQRLAGLGRAIAAVGFSPQGQHLLWTTQGQGREFHRLRLPGAERSLGASFLEKGEIENGFQRERLTHGGRSLHARRGREYDLPNAILKLRQGDTVAWSIERSAKDGYYHSAYTFTPDGQRIISGGVGVLTAYDLRGRVLGYYVGHIDKISTVAVSPDGKLLASGSSDQTVRLWNLETFELLLTLFHGSDGEWVAWAPSGHYAASPNGDRYVGWQINRGPERNADYVTAAQLREQLYRPDIVEQVLRLRNVEQAVNQAADTEFKVTQLNKALPPAFTIVSPPDGSRVREALTPLILDFAENPEPVTSIEAHVNGRQVTPRGVRAVAPQAASAHQPTLRVPLESGENRIRIAVKNRIGVTTRELLLHLVGQAELDDKGNLYLVAIGVNKYPHYPDLAYAAADARAVHAALSAQAGKVYRQVKAVLLADGAKEPTKANIEDALDMFAQATPQDTVVLFLAGHGVNEGADYYFLPQEARLEADGRWQKSTVVKWRLLQDALESSAGRRLLLVDTCHAGNAFNPRLLKDAADANIIVISAADSETLAQERSELGHGVFTYALLQGLQGRADSKKDGLIKIKELDSYLSDTVEEITRGEQKPVLHVPGGFKNFVFAKSG